MQNHVVFEGLVDNLTEPELLDGDWTFVLVHTRKRARSFSVRCCTDVPQVVRVLRQQHEPDTTLRVTGFLSPYPPGSRLVVETAYYNPPGSDRRRCREFSEHFRKIAEAHNRAGGTVENNEAEK